MNGTTITGTATLSEIADGNWRIEATGDFNGDGNVDILWRHYGIGENALWYMTGSTLTEIEYPISVTDVNWNIENH